MLSGKKCLREACLLPPQKGSKYCCSRCGFLVASSRLQGFLFQENDFLCLSDKEDLKNLGQLLKQKADIENMLQDVRLEEEELNKSLELRNALSPSPSEEIARTFAELWDCSSCGQTVSCKNAWSHIEKCYMKVETSLVVLNSFQPRHLKNVQEDIFCNYFHPTTGEYCQRLYMLCFDHGLGKAKKKVSDSEVCAFPSSKGVCQVLAHKCSAHLNWEKVQMGRFVYDRIRLSEMVVDCDRQISNLRSNIWARKNLYHRLQNNTVSHHPTS
eukprot:Sdes_comp19883_c0_seq1m12198